MALSAMSSSSSVRPQLTSLLPHSHPLHSLSLNLSSSSYPPLSSSSSASSLKLSRSTRALPRSRSPNPKGLRVNCSGRKPLNVMISGAPASGKGTQCQMIVEKYGLVHISTGDLLRAEVSSGTEIGNKAKEYMDNGRLVPDEIVTDMVISRISREDVRERGWLLDGYPRTFLQAQSLEKLKIRPDIYIMLDVLDEILIDRCVGRRLDPVTSRIYHIKNFPPETEEISARLITRPDDTYEKVKTRLETYKQNAEAILSTYVKVLTKIDGNRSREVIFLEIDSLLQRVQEDSVKFRSLGNCNDLVPVSKITLNVEGLDQDKWRGIPTRLNNIPHSREIREYFYDDVLQATLRAIEDKRIRLKLRRTLPLPLPLLLS